jgi:hypothetical protein
VFHLLGWRVSATAQTFIILTVAILLIFAACVRDGSLILPGDGTGLLEHPAIYCYFIEQALVQSLVIRAVNRFWRLWNGAVVTTFNSGTIWREELLQFRKATSRRTNIGRISFIVLCSAGIAVWAHNTYSNLHPERVGHDFWDSSHFVMGYWITRLYKFYFWVLWIPALTHVQFCLIHSVTRIIRRSVSARAFELKPYHPDGYGGTGSLISTVFTPMVVVILIAATGSAAAFAIHRRFDVTTTGGLLFPCALFLGIYLWPALVLRRAIIAEKNRQVQEISSLQSMMYTDAVTGALSPELLKVRVDAIERLTTVIKDLKKLPNWPHFRKIAGALGALGSSQVVVWLLHQLTAYVSKWLHAFSI